MAMRIEDLYRRFSDSALSVTDEEARFLMASLRVSYNVEQAILDYLSAYGHICYYKPHLSIELFSYPASALVCMGIDTYAKARASYIEFLVNEEGASYTNLSDEAREWLRREPGETEGKLDKVIFAQIGRV